MTSRIKVTKTINGKETFLSKDNSQAKIEEEIRRREMMPKKSKRAFETTIFYNDLKLKELKAKLLGITGGKKLMIDEVLKILDFQEKTHRENPDEVLFTKDDRCYVCELLKELKQKLNQLKKQK